MKLKIIQRTFLKTQIEQAASLRDDQKVAIAPPAILELHSWRDADAGHLFVEVELNGKRTAYVFEGHVQLEDDNGIILSAEAAFDSAPQVDRKEPPDNDFPESDRGQRIHLPGRTPIYLNDPIIAGGSFYWHEALHNGSRIPKSEEHVDAIARLARELEVARKQINQPMIVTSWYRPEPFNSRVGGARRSTHLWGGGVDIRVEGESGRSLAKRLSWWKGGLGIYPKLPRIIHLDIGPRRRWGL